MNLAAPAAAIAPFMDAEVTVLPHTRAAEAAKPVKLPACVREAAPMSADADAGASASANGWSVSVPAGSVPAGVEIVRGAEVEADAASGRPRLFVRKVSRNGAVLHLECDAHQIGG